MSAWSGLGEALPLAVGIAISPVPVTAAILMLLSPRAKQTAVGFLVGWVIGIVLTASVFTLLGSVIPKIDSAPDGLTTGVIIQFALGLLLLWLSIRQWRGRPKPGEEQVQPKWMSALDTIKPGAALLMGTFLSSINPKNLLLHVSAGIRFSEITDSAALVATVAVYAAIASLTVGAPVICYLASPKRFERPLISLREWLLQHNAAVMTVLLLVLGINLISKSIAAL